jgi:hypothetical protein
MVHKTLHDLEKLAKWGGRGEMVYHVSCIHDAVQISGSWIDVRVGGFIVTSRRGTMM